MPVFTTLNAIKKASPCEQGWKKLLRGLNTLIVDDTPIPLVKILEINGIHDAVWCLRCIKEYDLIVLFAQKCANNVASIKNEYAAHAAKYAAYAAKYAETAYAAEAAAYAAHAAAYAETAYAAAYAANAAEAAAEAAAAKKLQWQRNTEFFIECFGQ